MRYLIIAAAMVPLAVAALAPSQASARSGGPNLVTYAGAQGSGDREIRHRYYRHYHYRVRQ